MLNYNVQVDESSEKLVHGEIQKINPSNNPFPGLRPFTIEECHLFFGREGQVDHVLVKLIKNRFIAVMGFSGSGKSSLMTCGLVPILLGGFTTEGGPFWNIISTRPGKNPFANLAASIFSKSLQQGDYDPEDAPIHEAIISTMLRSSKDGLTEVLKSYFPDSKENVLLLVDQFEELFRYRDEDNPQDYDEALAFVNILMNGTTQTEVPVHIALTMRSDHIGECALFPGLTQMVNKSNYLVPQMTREQKRMAIEGPVAVGGGQISQRLVKRLLGDIEKNQDQLPILQHAMMRTWEYWTENREDDEPLDVRHYNAIGKIDEALSRHANEAFEELNLREKQIAEILFKTITEKGDENLGVRRPERLNKIAELAGASDADVIKVINHFRREGRSFLMPGYHVPLNGDSVIEISHESLMRIWTRLRNWVEEEYESAKMYRRLSDAATLYQIGKSGVWRPPDLQLALNWQKKQKPTRLWAERYHPAFERTITFLDTSRITYEADEKNKEALQKRLIKRTRAVAVILGIAAIIAILFFVYALTQQAEALRKEQEAVVARGQAEDNLALAKESEKKAQEDRELAEKATEEALRLFNQLQESAIELKASKELAERANASLKEQIEIADLERKNALINEDKAIKAEELMRVEADRANQNFFRSLARSVALKSLQVEDQELKANMAKLAYDLHTKYGGEKHDPNIHNALYSALMMIDGRSFNTAPGHRSDVRSVAFANSGLKLFSTGSEGKVLIKNADRVNTVQTSIPVNRHPNKMIRVSPDDQWVVMASDSSVIKVLQANDMMAQPKDISGHKSFVSKIAFEHKGSKFYSTGGDRTIRLNDPTTGTSQQMAQLNFIPQSLAVIRDGSALLIGSPDGKVLKLDVATKQLKELDVRFRFAVHALAIDPSGKMVAMGGETGNIKIYNLVTNLIEKEFNIHKSRVTALEYSPSGKYLASSSLDKTIRVWENGKFEELPYVFNDNNGYVWDIDFSADERFIAGATGGTGLGTSDGEVRVWALDPKEYADQICGKINRNMTLDEWNSYVDSDTDFRESCISLRFEIY